MLLPLPQYLLNNVKTARVLMQAHKRIQILVVLLANALIWKPCNSLVLKAKFEDVGDVFSLLICLSLLDGGLFTFKLCQISLWWRFKLCVRWTKVFIWLSGTLKDRVINPSNQAFANVYPGLPFGEKKLHFYLWTYTDWRRLLFLLWEARVIFLC